jgi:AraC family transcriptional regulator
VASPRSPILPLPTRREYVASDVALRGLRCVESHLPAAVRIAKHSHERDGISVVLNGGAFEHRPRGRQPTWCDSGVVMVRPRNTPHANEVGGDGIVVVDVELGDDMLGDRVTLRAAAFRSAAAVAVAARIARELQRRDDAAALIVEGLALEIVGLAMRCTRGARQLDRGDSVRRAYDTLRAEFRTKLTIAGLARDAGMHPVAFARAFRRRYGCSAGELLRNLRVEWAATELATRPDRPIADIAVAAGFYDQSHLGRMVAKYTGQTPAAHRRGRRG